MSSPSAPIIRTNCRVFPSAIRYYWSTPTSTGDSPLSSYTLTCSSISYSNSVPYPVSTVVVENLPSSITYIFQVFATNSNGNEGPPATFVPYQTGVKPDIPNNIRVSTVSCNAVLVTWSTPTTNGGAEINRYAIWSYPTSTGTDILSNVSSYTLKRYTYGNELSRLLYFDDVNSNYKITVRAINSPGWSLDLSGNYTDISTLRLFNPSTLSNIAFWIDPTVSSSYILQNDSSLYRVNSLVNSNDFLSGEYGPSIAPSFLNSRNVFSFNQSQLMSNLSVEFSTSGYTIFSLMYSLNPQSIRIINGSIDDIRLYIGQNGSSILTAVGNTGGWNSLDQNLPPVILYSNWRIVGMSYSNNTALYPYSDGIVQNVRNGSGRDFTGLVFGGTHYAPNLNGYSAETIILPYVLTPFERQKLEGYLAWKWGLQQQLPTSHPFRSIIPRAHTVFSPNLYSSLSIWLDASDSSTYTLSSLTVRSWTDKSGCNNSPNIIYGNPRLSNSAINNRSAIWFDSISSSFIGPYVNRSGFATAFAVATYSSISGDRRMLSVGELGQPDQAGFWRAAFITTTSTSNLSMWKQNTANQGAILASVSMSTFNTPFIVSMTYSNGTASNSFNGGFSIQTGGSSGDLSTIQYALGTSLGTGGGNTTWSGYIGEFLMFNSALSSEDRQTVEGYLAWKWGIKNILPLSNPYVANDPTSLVPLSSLSVVTSSLLIRFEPSNYVDGASWSNLGSLGATRNATIEAGSPVRNSERNGIILNGTTNFLFSNPALGNAWTVSFWFKRTRNINTSACIITQVWNNATTNMTAYITGSGSNLAGGYLTGGGVPRIGTAVGLLLNRWYQITYTWNGSNIITYVDGVVNSQIAQSVIPTDSGSNYRIGRRWDLTDYVIGEIGQLLMYNRTLTQSEVIQNFIVNSNTYINPPYPNDQIVQYNARNYNGVGGWSNTGSLGSAYTMTLSTGLISTNARGNGVVFNGSTSYRAVSTGTLTYRNLNQYTLSMWFKRTSTIDVWGSVVAARFNPDSPFYIIRASNDFPSELRAGLFANNTSTLATKYHFAENTWINLIAVHSGSNILTYINGSTIGAVSSISTPVYSGTTYLGYNGTASFVRGELGDFSLYNRMLSPRDVYLMYTSTYKDYEITPYFRYTPSNFASGGPWSNNGFITGNQYNAILSSGTLALNTTSTALLFSTSAYLAMSSISTLANFTVSAWFKRTNFLSNYAGIISDGFSNGQINLSMVCEANGSGFYVGFHNNGWYRSDTYYLERNKWYHLTGTWDTTSKQVRYYVNGLLWNTTNHGATISTNTSGLPYKIGNHWDGTSSGLRGELGEIMIYNHPLSPQQINDYYISTSYLYPNPAISTQMLLQYSYSNFSTGVWSNTGTLGSTFNATTETGTPTLNSLTSGVFFNGSTSMVIPDIGSVPKYTVSAWVKRSAAQRDSVCVFTRINQGQYIDMALRYDNNNISYRNLIFAGNSLTTSATSNSLPETWHHVVCTWDGYGARNYLNGVLQTVNNQRNLISESGNTNLRMGRGWDSGTSLYYFGEIGEVRLYNNFLSSNEVASLYSTTSSSLGLVNIVPSTAMLIHFNAPTYSGTGAWTNNGTLGTFYNATIENGTPSKNAAGNGIVFNGSMNFQFSNIGSLSNLTVMTWFKRTTATLNGSGQVACIVTAAYDGSINYWNFHIESGLEAGPSSIVFGYLHSGSFNGATSVELPLNTWTHFAATHDGSTIRTYVNGNLRGSVANSRIPENNQLRYLIGRRWDQAQYLRGELGELRVYNRALAATDILNVYNTTSSIFSL